MKARILGAVVTVLAMALVLPNVLDGNPQKDRLLTAMPPKPDTPEWVNTGETKRVKIQLDDLASGEFEKRITAPEPKVVKEDDPKVPQIPGDRGGLDDKSMPVAWVLQVGAFKSIENATRFRDELRAKGFKAYTQRHQNGELERVLVGPVLQRSKAEKMRTDLGTEMSLEGIRIRQYSPE